MAPYSEYNSGQCVESLVSAGFIISSDQLICLTYPCGRHRRQKNVISYTISLSKQQVFLQKAYGESATCCAWTSHGVLAASCMWVACLSYLQTLGDKLSPRARGPVNSFFAKRHLILVWREKYIAPLYAPRY